MINIFFWNTGLNYLNKNRDNELFQKKYQLINDILVDAVGQYKIDILILAEYPLDLEPVCDKISLTGKDFKAAHVPADTRVKLLTDRKFTSELIGDSRYFFISRIDSPVMSSDFLLAGVHLSSQLHVSKTGIETEARQVMFDIREAERRGNTDRCMIIGDFNLSPFDNALTNCDSFNALPYADIVLRKEKRRFYGKDYQMFYNPMWNFLGDYEGKQQTYFYDSSEPSNLYRYVFDQILISAPMLDLFVPSSVKVISEINGKTLIKNGNIPDKQKYSDHLPIMFSMREDYDEQLVENG
ncbi:MAG: endonuclease/exonuclease/phosphatase family protein [Lachnospiraceae bacterium]|nr:endonuclease/exonuclease/phosphatase family protein [Lachnospiraceae bacterium]